MQVQYTTPKGAKIELTLCGKAVEVSVNGQHYGQLTTDQEHPENGYVLRVEGKPGMIGVPAADKPEVQALLAEQGRRITAAWAGTDEARFEASMMVHERNDDDGVDRAERVWR